MFLKFERFFTRNILSSSVMQMKIINRPSKFFNNLNFKINFWNLFSSRKMQQEWTPELWRKFTCVQQPTYLNQKEVEEQTSQVLFVKRIFSKLHFLS